jgi:large conductance mechanosensitive channel
MLKDFKAFLKRGNVVDLAVAVIIGAAFGAIVKSLTDDILMPVIGLLTGGVDFTDKFIVLEQGSAAPAPYVTLAEAKEAGAVTLNYGVFINQIVTFLIVAFFIFLLVRALKKMERPAPAAAPTTKPCPHCATEIPVAATRCPHCTSQL